MSKIVVLVISIILNIVEGQNRPNYVNLCNFQNIGSSGGHHCQGLQELKIEAQSSQNENFWCVLLDNRNGHYTNQVLKFGFTGGINSVAQVYVFLIIFPNHVLPTILPPVLLQGKHTSRCFKNGFL